MKNYKFIRTVKFDKDFDRLDNSIKILVLKYIKKIENSENPRLYGKELSGNLKGLWRYRVENYRLICEIKDNELIIIAISIGHRSIIYKKLER